MLASGRRLTRVGLGLVIATMIAGAGCSQAERASQQPASRGTSSAAAPSSAVWVCCTDR